jgi:hypothetical protein
MHIPLWSPLGERAPTLVAGLFGDALRAERAAAELRREPGQHTLVIHPRDPQTARKLEPEQLGIWRTLVRSHALLMPLGGLLGVAAAAALSAGGWAAAQLSPLFAMLFLGVAGAFFGGMLAGLLTLRPDHGLVIRRVRAALAQGAHAVVVHPLDEAHARTARAALERAGAVPMRSL